MRRALAGALAAMLLGAPAPGVLAHGGAPHASEAKPSASRHRWGADYFPNVPLFAHDGRKLRFYDDLIKGKSVAINFIYTECTEVCPLETAVLAQAHKLLGERAGRDVHFYSISMDPQRDTPAVLKAYAERFGATWLFLTGAPEDIRLLGRKLGLLRERDAALQGHHAAQLLIGDEPAGQWTRTSAVDTPAFLVARMGSLLGWREDPGAQKSYADAKPVTVPNGQRLFASKCSACHSLGKGEGIGPDLAGVTTRRERAWLARYIQAPDALRAAGDPVASALYVKYKKIGMPNLKLGASDVADLLSFLEGRTTPARQP